MTGNLDEVQIKTIIDLDKSMTALTDRKATVLAKIEEQGKLTAELKKAIENAEKLADVEELYLPYKEKTSYQSHYRQRSRAISTSSF